MTAPGPRKPHLQGAQNALGEFLRARRRLVTPEEVGIPVTGRRRAPGLRREELAMLAGVSSPYYIRLEQGHDRHPSAQVVDALGHALRLDDETFAYLKRLAGQVAIETRPPGDESVRSTVAQLVHGLQDVAALVIGRYRDVLVANRLAPMLHVAYTPGENLLRFLFLDPARANASSTGNRSRGKRSQRCAWTPAPTSTTRTSASSSMSSHARAPSFATCGPATRPPRSPPVGCASTTLSSGPSR